MTFTDYVTIQRLEIAKKNAIRNGQIGSRNCRTIKIHQCTELYTFFLVNMLGQHRENLDWWTEIHNVNSYEFIILIGIVHNVNSYEFFNVLGNGGVNSDRIKNKGFW